MVNRKILIAVHGFAIGAVAALFLLSFAVIVMAAPALSNPGGGSWQYSEDITISNPGGALSDYQVLVQLSGSNFPANARSDGADIRFTDAGGNELSYWIEKWDSAGRSAKIWVKVPSIGGGMTNVRMYYGNSMAGGVSNGEATFVFFDDFSGDLSKWDVANAMGIWEIENGEVSGTMSGIAEASLFANGLSIENGVVEYKYRYLLDNTAAGIQIRSSSNIARSNFNVMFFDHPELNANYLQSYEKGVMSESKVDFNSAVNTYYNAKLEFNGVSIKGTLDTVLNPRTLDLSQTGRFGLILLYGIANGHQHWDDIRVRKYASSEPIVTLGAEQPSIPPTTVPSTPTTTQTAEPESSAVLLHGEKTEVLLGEDVLLKLSAVNLIANPPMNVQVILYPPSGMSVTSSEFVKSGAGIYTTTYSLAPSEGKDIEVRIKTNQVGDFNVKGRIVYYFGDNKSSVEDHTLNLPIKVRKESAPAQDERNPEQKQTPGFEVITSVSGLLLSILLMRGISKLCLKN